MSFLPDCKDPLLPMPKIVFPSDLINRFQLCRVTILQYYLFKYDTEYLFLCISIIAALFPCEMFD
jgi:hypothetical protein